MGERGGESACERREQFLRLEGDGSDGAAPKAARVCDWPGVAARRCSLWRKRGELICTQRATFLPARSNGRRVEWSGAAQRRGGRTQSRPLGVVEDGRRGSGRRLRGHGSPPEGRDT